MDTTEAARVVSKSEALGKDASSLMPGGLVSAFDAWYTPRRLEIGDWGLSIDANSEGRMANGEGEFLFRYSLFDILNSNIVVAKGKGARLTDVDGNEYLDYMGAHGALILGHADERVVAAISKAASKGSGFGAASEIEVRLTELIVSRFPTIDMLRLVNTPAEALTGVVALARSHTGRSGIVTFDGCWHSYVGSVSAQAADGGTAESSPAVPYNSVEVIEELFRNRGSGIAAVIVEPVAASIGLIPPADGFLAFLRSLCDDHNVLLVFDETLTGFRLTPGGADAFYGVRPDLTLLGPIIGGGLPLAAYGGCKEVMKHADRNTGMPRTSPAAGNLLGMAAGLATLQAVGESGFYEALEAQSARLDEGLRAAAAAACVPTCHTRVASMLGMFFGEITVTDSASASRCDTALFAHYHRAMLDRGVFLPPSPLSPLFVSAAHSNDEIDRTIEAAHDALRIAGESSRR